VRENVRGRREARRAEDGTNKLAKSEADRHVAAE
jgi:hypothetical protein